MSIYLTKGTELEERFKSLGEQLVMKIDDPDRLRIAVTQRIAQNADFMTMPSYRQFGVMQFIEGLALGKALLSGKQAAFRVSTPEKPKLEDVPRKIKQLQPDASWHKHPNGGGWVSSTAYVEASAHVGQKAVVYENARVLERARVYGKAIVRGTAECFGACHVHGLAIVEGKAKVFDGAKVLGKVILKGSVAIGGDSLVRGEKTLSADKEIIDQRIAPDAIKIDKRKTSGPTVGA